MRLSVPRRSWPCLLVAASAATLLGPACQRPAAPAAAAPALVVTRAPKAPGSPVSDRAQPWEVVLRYPPALQQAVAARRPTRTLRGATTTTVYLAFDGATIQNAQDSDSLTNSSFLPFAGGCGDASPSVTIPAFDASFWAAHGTRAQVIDTIVRLLGDVYADHNIRFVATRPTSGDYTMTVVGGACEDPATLCQAYGVLGISPLDCASDQELNLNPDDINFICSDSIAGFGMDLLSLVYTIAHEDAHTFGLAHIDRAQDIMYESIAGGAPLTWGSGTVNADGSCSSDGSQDDVAYLLRAIGGSNRTADTSRPHVAVIWPPDGTLLGSGPFDVRVLATDPSGVAQVDLYLDGAAAHSLGVSPFVFGLVGVAPGTHQLMANATDWFYNAATSEPVAITVSAPPPPCQTEADCDAGRSCQDGVCTTGSPPGATGAACALGADCQSGTCVTDAQSYCTEDCANDGSCPDGYDCQEQLCIVLGAPPGGTGAPCATDADCRSGPCADIANGGYCTEACDPDGAPCPNGGACEKSGDGGTALCGRTPSDVADVKESGCAAAPSGASPLAALAPLALLALTRRRRRGGTIGRLGGWSAVVAVVVVVAGCRTTQPGSSSCTPGDQKDCTCDDGASGRTTCMNDGTGELAGALVRRGRSQRRH